MKCRISFNPPNFLSHEDCPQYWTPTLRQVLCWAPYESVRGKAWGIGGNKGHRHLQTTQPLPSGHQFCPSTHVSSFPFLLPSPTRWAWGLTFQSPMKANFAGFLNVKSYPYKVITLQGCSDTDLMLKPGLGPLGGLALLTPENTYVKGLIAGVIPLLMIMRERKNTVQVCPSIQLFRKEVA